MRVLLLICFLTLEPVTAGEPARLLFSRVGPTRIGLFLADADNGNQRALLPADGSGVRRLTQTGGNDAHGIWSPDGEWIVFSSSRLGVRQLTDNQWEDALPSFQPGPK